MALIFLDLDDFKRINDQYGHPMGSQCLTELAQIMTKSVRDVDILALTPAGRAGEVAKRYAADLSAIAPAVLVMTLYGRVVSAVTDDWRRFDLSFVEPAELSRYDRDRLAALFNRTGHEPPAGNTPPHRVDPAQLSQIIA